MPSDVGAAKLGGACIRRDHCTKDHDERAFEISNAPPAAAIVLLFSLVSALAPDPK
jgi:hypothetical protein